MNATAKRGFRDPMEFVHAANEPTSPQTAPHAAPEPLPATEAPAKPAEARMAPQIPSRRAPPTRPANVRIPVDLHEELRQFWKDTDIPMSEVMIEGTRERLAKLKKQYGLG
jgi:hypothetical protein